MNYFVLLKMVPDTVEELEVAPDHKSLDADLLRFKMGDSDEHALEQALVLKEKHGGKVTVVALDAPEVDDALFTALAKGADQAVKIVGDLAGLQSLGAAKLMSGWLAPEGNLAPDTLILLRGQSYDDLEGEIGPALAELLRAPFVGVVTGVAPEGGKLRVLKEFSGGLRGEFVVPLPAVLGIQSAEKPPRYVPIAKVRAAQKTGRIETVEVAAPEPLAAVAVARMYKPEPTGRAKMLEGGPEEIAEQIVEVLAQNSVI